MKQVILYAYTYPAFLALAEKYGMLFVKFGMTKADIDQTTEESTWDRLNHQTDANEAEDKILLACWLVNSDTLINDHVVHNLLKRDGYRNNSLLTGSGKEWFSFPFDFKDKKPEPLAILERYMSEIAGKGANAFTSVLSGPEFKIDFDGKQATIEQAYAYYEEKFPSIRDIGLARIEKIKNRNRNIRSLLKDLIVAALKKHKTSESKKTSFVNDFVFREFVKPSIAAMVETPAILPCRKTAEDFLDRVPAEATSLAVVNDVQTFLWAYFKRDFEELVFIGNDTQVASLSMLDDEPHLSFHSIGNGHRDTSKAGFTEQARRLGHVDAIIVNTSRTAGESEEAWIQPAIDTGAKHIIFGALADNFLNARPRSSKAREKFLSLFENKAVDFELVADPFSRRDLRETFFINSSSAGEKGKSHFEPVCIVSITNGDSLIVTDKERALTYGSNVETPPHPLVNTLDTTRMSLAEFRDMTHLGYLPGISAVIEAFSKLSKDLETEFITKANVVMPKSTGNPPFRVSHVPDTIEVLFADGIARQIEKRFLLQTKPKSGSGLVSHVVLGPSPAPIKHAWFSEFPSERRAKAYIEHATKDKVLIAIYAVLKMKQNAVSSIIASDLPPAGIPWEDIEVGSFGKYLAVTTGLNLDQLQALGDVTINTISVT